MPISIKENNMPIIIVEAAEAFAKKIHEGQQYGNEDYFEYHLLGVKKIADTIASNFEYAEIDRAYLLSVAVLHDTIEDHDISRDDIHCEFGDDILIDVMRLSRHPNMDYAEYIHDLALKGTMCAIIVKLADLSFNIRHGEAYGLHPGDPAVLSPEELRFNKQRLAKYKLAYRYIVAQAGQRYSILNHIRL